MSRSATLTEIKSELLQAMEYYDWRDKWIRECPVKHLFKMLYFARKHTTYVIEVHLYIKELNRRGFSLQWRKGVFCVAERSKT